MIDLIEITRNNQVQVREVITYLDGDGPIRTFHRYVAGDDDPNPTVKALKAKLKVTEDKKEDGFHKKLDLVRIAVNTGDMLIQYKREVVKNGKTIAQEITRRPEKMDGNFKDDDERVQIIADAVRNDKTNK